MIRRTVPKPGDWRMLPDGAWKIHGNYPWTMKIGEDHEKISMNHENLPKSLELRTKDKIDHKNWWKNMGIQWNSPGTVGT